MRPLYIFLMVSLVAPSLLTAQDIPSKKHADKAVQDYIGLLTVNEQELLNTKLKNYADSTSTGIAIAIRNDIDDDINFYAARMLTEWGLGQEKEDNGVLFLLDIEQRKIAISTGYGVEHLLTDNLSKRIITKLIIPEFKNGNFYTGLDKGTTAAIEILSGAYINSLTTTSESEDIPVFFILVFFIILIIIISNKKRRGGGRGGRRFRNDDAVRSLLEAIILSSSGRGGFGGSGGFGSGSSGGGFGGFGGGMGGGGGASGSW